MTSIALSANAAKLMKLADAKADIARLKGEKEAFEQSNAPEDLDEEELAAWNYAKDLDRQIREIRTEHKEAMKQLKKLERAATKVRSTTNEKSAAAEAEAALTPVFDQLAALESDLRPYEQIKQQLAEARARYRALTGEFVNELKARCGAMTEEEKRTLVLELFAEDLLASLNAAVFEKRQELARFFEGLWDKYRVTLREIENNRIKAAATLKEYLGRLSYT